MFSATRLDMLCFVNKDNFSLPLINTKRLRGNILSVLWLEEMNRTTRMFRCKFDSSNIKQMRDFLKDRRNCHLDFLRKLEDQRE